MIEAIQCLLVWWSNLVLLDLSAKRSSPAPVRQKSVQKQKLKRRRLYRFKNRQSYDLTLVRKKRKVWREILTINWCYGRNKVRKYGRFVTLWLKTWRKRLWSCCWKWMVKKFPPEKARLVPCLVPPWAGAFSWIAMIRYFHQWDQLRQSVSTALLLQILDALSDCMAFGALEPCPECKEGQLALRYMNGPLCNATACCAIGIY